MHNKHQLDEWTADEKVAHTHHWRACSCSQGYWLVFILPSSYTIVVRVYLSPFNLDLIMKAWRSNTPFYPQLCSLVIVLSKSSLSSIAQIFFQFPNHSAAYYITNAHLSPTVHSTLYFNVSTVSCGHLSKSSTSTVGLWSLCHLHLLNEECPFK